MNYPRLRRWEGAAELVQQRGQPAARRSDKGVIPQDLEIVEQPRAHGVLVRSVQCGKQLEEQVECGAGVTETHLKVGERQLRFQASGCSCRPDFLGVASVQALEK